MRFILVLLVLISYTGFKATDLWPRDPLVAALLAIPLFLIMIGGALIYRARPAVFEEKWYQALSWVGSFVMGVWSTFIFLSIPFDLLRLAVLAFQKIGPTAQIFSSLEVFMGQPLALGLLLLSVVFSSLGFLEVLRGPMVRNVEIHFENLPEALVGLKIVQLSDLHIGHSIRKPFIEKIVAKTNGVQPDLIFITGDIADAKAHSILADMKPLGNLQARYGVFYVTGNHEYYWGAHELIAQVAGLKIIPLINSNEIVKVGVAKLLIAGVTDPMGGNVYSDHKPNLKVALECTEKTDLTILLAHRPGVSEEAEKARVDLQFSGHTHAGQYFPFNLVIGFFHKYYRGLNRHGGLWVYVNPGTGYWGPANRFAVSSEITVATLLAK